MTPPEQPTPPSPPEPASIPWFMQEGDRVRNYTVHRPIGEGSGSIVYEVEDEAGVHFALKLSCVPLAATGESPIQCERFYQSAIVHYALRDSVNVVKLAEAGVFETPQGAYPYLVMELVPRAECITAWAAHTTPTLANLVGIFIDLADTLGTMADQKICHRDLKPQNILIAPEDVPKIIDLNSASFPMRKTLTAPAASAIPGTQVYFSPELAAAVLAEMETGETARYEYAPTDDLYSLGCVFYEVLTGQVPCCDLSGSPTTILRQIVRDKPPLPVELNTSVPWSVSKVVMRLLEKDPAQRYQSGHDVARELETACERTAQANWFEPFIVPQRVTHPKLPSWLAPAASRHRRRVARFRRRWAGKIALVATLTVAALVAWVVLGQHCPPESSAEKGSTVLCKAKVALVAAASTTLSCVGGLMGYVRADDEKYLAECPAEAKDTVKSLHIAPYDLMTLDDGPTVKAPGYGYEMKAGPIEVKPGILDHLGGGSLLGEIRVGSDGASVHFNKLKLNSDGIERPVCGIAWGDDSRPGLRRMPNDDPNRVPDSKLHPNEGFIYVVGPWFMIDLATSGPKPELWPVRGAQSPEGR